ncbi:MAG: hypothetical protein ACLFVS_03140 [Candidatus Acetothermia bacterium]
MMGKGYSEARKKLQDDPEVEVALADLRPEQQEAILNWQSGDSWYQAMVDAGYSEAYAKNSMEFRSQPSVKAYFRGAKKRFREKYINEAIELAGRRMVRALATGDVYGALVSLIKVALRYGGLEPASRSEVDVRDDRPDGGAELDLTKLYDVLDEEEADEVIRAIQE